MAVKRISLQKTAWSGGVEFNEIRDIQSHYLLSVSDLKLAGCQWAFQFEMELVNHSPPSILSFYLSKLFLSQTVFKVTSRNLHID